MCVYSQGSSSGINYELIWNVLKYVERQRRKVILFFVEGYYVMATTKLVFFLNLPHDDFFTERNSVFKRRPFILAAIRNMGYGSFRKDTKICWGNCYFCYWETMYFSKDDIFSMWHILKRDFFHIIIIFFRQVLTSLLLALWLMATINMRIIRFK